MAEFGRNYQVVVHDDASSDRTPAVLTRYRTFLPLRVLRTEERIGYGAALEKALRDITDRSRYPKRDVVVTLQADLTENPEDLVGMVKLIEGGADLVAGRMVDGGRILPRSVRIARRLAPLLLGTVMRRAPVSDPLSGFRAYRLIVMKKALRESSDGKPLLRSTSWGTNLELLARASPHARRIEESPYRVRLDHRERASRFRPVPSLGALLPLRGTSWPTLALS
jgi:dolichol-phosphate mannosyltransferase